MTTSPFESEQPIDKDYRQPEWDLPTSQSPFGDESNSVYPPPQWERLPHSMWGIASFAMSLFFAFVLFALVCVCGYIMTVNPEAADQDPPHLGLALAGLGLFGACFAQLAALALGIVGLCQPRTRKAFSIFGVFFSIMSIGIITALIILGIMVG